MKRPEIKKSICGICTCDCGIDAWVQDGRLVKIEGSRECPNQGKLCIKGYATREYVERPDRIRTPLRRIGERGAGEFEPISWDEAYSHIAQRLYAIKAEYGADSVAFYSGYSKLYRTMLHRFAHSFGSINYGTESSSCFQAMRIADVLNAGCLSRPDTANADLLIGWGFNPFYSRVNPVEPLLRLREKGLKILAIDPKLTPFAQLADMHLQIRSGTDGALAHYFARYLIERGAVDHDYIREHVHGYEEYAEYVRAFDAETVSRITGVAEPALEQAAQMLVDNPRFAITEGAAPITHHINGVQNFRAMLALSAISGNYDREGGNIPVEFSDRRVNSDARLGDGEFIDEVRPKNHKPKIGSGRFPVWSELIDEFQAMDLPRQILEGTPYPVKAVFALGMNAYMFPGNGKLFEALRSLDFFVDVDIFMNDTASYADIVLPACTSLERSQFQGGYMGMYMNPQTVKYVAAAIEPLYESRSDADILCQLAEVMELDDPLLKGGYDVCCRRLLRKVGVTFSELQTTGASVKIPGMEPYYPGDNTVFGYGTPTGKYELTSEVLRRHGYDPLPVYKPSAQTGQEYPLLLTAGGRLPYHFHSR
ncbi:MAG: molybdopterin-dependent oxidoreductase, partial [Oscillospiraceae bacterium]|nr:molybdopterin-dependent oxidoreductase [Oscillospiraceae bacterium]